MAKLGFTFYPKDWWTSDTYFDLDSIERYIYLECIFLMYQNEGYLDTTIEKLEVRIRTQIKPSSWEKITQRFNLTKLGYTHNSVKKRRSKADVSRDNGKKGGRPKKPNNPVINPPLEREREREVKKNIKGIEERKNDFKKSLSNFSENYNSDLLNDFYSYWTEHGDRDKKMRFEKEKSFGISLRLSKWSKNQKKWDAEKVSKKRSTGSEEFLRQFPEEVFK